MEWELLGALLSTFSQVLASSGTSGVAASALAAAAPPLAGVSGALLGGVGLRGVGGPLQLSERGVLQLLFDLRLARDVLAGGRPLVTVQVRGAATVPLEPACLRVKTSRG